LDLQSTREFFINKEISVYPKKEACHQDKNNNFIKSICSLKNHQYHHNHRPDSDKAPGLTPRKSKPHQSMMKVRIIPVEWIFFHYKDSIKPNPNRIKQW
jgi:hypothetical protein